MTVQPNLKSTGITRLDASPRTANTSGAPGGPGRLVVVSDTAPALTTGNTAGGIIRMVRIPSNCIVKRVLWAVNNTTTTADVDVGLYYSDIADGTSAANVAATATAIDADFFASQVDVHTISTAWVDITFEAGTYLPSMTGLPIWDAVPALTSDPGGFFDVCYTNTSTTNGAPVLSMLVQYVQPN